MLRAVLASLPVAWPPGKVPGTNTAPSKADVLRSPSYFVGWEGESRTATNLQPITPLV